MTTEINTVHLNCVSLLVMATICSLAFIRNTGSRLRECLPTLKLRPKNKRTAVRLLSPAIYRRALAQVKTTMVLGTNKNLVYRLKIWWVVPHLLWLLLLLFSLHFFYFFPCIWTSLVETIPPSHPPPPQSCNIYDPQKWRKIVYLITL